MPDPSFDLDQLCALLRQERTSYRCRDYLKGEGPQQLPLLLNHPSHDGDVGASSSVPSSAGGGGSRLTALDESSSPSSGAAAMLSIWREKMVQWTYHIVDHFSFDRETASVSLSYLDRFLSTRRVNQEIFQLTAMTTLHLAVKLYEQRTLKVSTLIGLSRGCFRSEHMMAMEKIVLKALSWRVHPPTPQGMSRQFFRFPPFSEDGGRDEACPDREDVDRRKKQVKELSHFFMELSVCDYFFVTRRPSSVSLASILNAFDIVESSYPESRCEVAATSRDFIEQVRTHLPELGIDDPDGEVADCRIRLEGIYRRSLLSSSSEGEASSQDEDGRIEGTSPNCVSELCCDGANQVLRQENDRRPCKRSKNAAKSKNNRVHTTR